MALGRPEDVAPDTVVHRVAGASVANLRLSPMDARQVPPGISVLLGGTPQDAATQMRQAFPNSKKWQRAAATVGSTSAQAIRTTGFQIVPDPTTRFPNHARLIHPQGVAGFSDENLKTLAKAFHEATGC